MNILKKIGKWLDDDHNLIFMCVLIGELVFLIALILKTISFSFAVL